MAAFNNLETVAANLVRHWRAMDDARVARNARLLCQLLAPSGKKPRIRLRFGVWGCVSRRPGGAGLIAGYGYTPMQAYEDWRSRASITDLTQ